MWGGPLLTAEANNQTAAYLCLAPVGVTWKCTVHPQLPHLVSPNSSLLKWELSDFRGKKTTAERRIEANTNSKTVSQAEESFPRLMAEEEEEAEVWAVCIFSKNLDEVEWISL